MPENKPLTGYPSIDKPWLKFCSEEEKALKVPKGSMFDYLYENNSAYPNDIALEYYGRTFSYRQLFGLINQCCRNLTALGIKRGDIVTVQAITLPQVIVVIYALTRIGACGNMLYPDAKAEDIVFSMKKTKSKLLIVVDRLLSTYEENLPDTFDSAIILLNMADQMSFVHRLLAGRKAAYTQKNLKLHTIPWHKFISGEGKEYQENHDGTLPAFMLRTGGTTGIPKEVVLCSVSFNAISAGVFSSRMCSHWERQKKSLLLLPPFIAFGISSGIHNSLTFGTQLIISLDIQPTAVSKLLSKNKPNYITAGTVQAEQFMADLEPRKDKLDYIEMLAIGGEAMSTAFEESLQNFLRKHGNSALPIKGYGLTETAGCVVAETIHAHRIGSVGIPMAFCNIKIIDPDSGKELTYNTPGEICVSSPVIMQGYFQNSQATDEIINTVNGEKWLHTGDIGTISEDGLLTITGRIKRIIVCRDGNVYHKVFPLLIEDKLAKVPGVQDISIVGRANKETGNELVAYVVPEKQSEFMQIEKTCREYCTSNLQVFERPVDYICMDKLPRTLIGKVDYRALEEMAKEGISHA